jgi:hypothetical protein
MNPFNMSKELNNLSNIINSVNNKASNIDVKVESLDSKIENIEINKIDSSELTYNIDNIKEEMKNLKFKIDLILKNQIINNYSKIQRDDEVTIFLESINIDTKTINIINLFNCECLDDILLIDKENLIELGIPETKVDFILEKVNEQMSSFV